MCVCMCMSVTVCVNRGAVFILIKLTVYSTERRVPCKQETAVLWTLEP